MKKLVILLTILTSLFVSPHTVSAQTVTPSPSQAKQTNLNDKLNDKISDLKEKIASRVSELNLVDRRGLIGTVSEVSGHKVTVKDSSGKSRIIDVDEITKFVSLSSSKSSFGLSDLTKGTKISVLGLYNKQSKRLLARFISTTVDPLFFSGTIVSVDPKNFQVTITTPDQKQTVVDIQTSTKMQLYTKEGLEKSGFSKFTVGKRVAVIGYPDKTNPSLLAAQRIVDLSLLPTNPNIAAPSTPASSSAQTSSPAPTKKKTTAQ